MGRLTAKGWQDTLSLTDRHGQKVLDAEREASPLPGAHCRQSISAVSLKRCQSPDYEICFKPLTDKAELHKTFEMSRGGNLPEKIRIVNGGSWLLGWRVYFFLRPD